MMGARLEPPFVTALRTLGEIINRPFIPVAIPCGGSNSSLPRGADCPTRAHVTISSSRRDFLGSSPQPYGAGADIAAQRAVEGRAGYRLGVSHSHIKSMHGPHGHGVSGQGATP